MNNNTRVNTSPAQSTSKRDSRKAESESSNNKGAASRSQREKSLQEILKPDAELDRQTRARLEKHGVFLSRNQIWGVAIKYLSELDDQSLLKAVSSWLAEPPRFS